MHKDLIKEQAERYVSELQIDQKDLSEKAKQQLKDAFIAGSINAEILRFFQNNDWEPTTNLRFVILPGNEGVKVEQEWIKGTNESEWRLTTFTNKYPVSSGK